MNLKIKSVLARLDRLGAVVDGVGDGELNQHVILFKCVPSTLHMST